MRTWETKRSTEKRLNIPWNFNFLFYFINFEPSLHEENLLLQFWQSLCILMVSLFYFNWNFLVYFIWRIWIHWLYETLKKTVELTDISSENSIKFSTRPCYSMCNTMKSWDTWKFYPLRNEILCFSNCLLPNWNNLTEPFRNGTSLYEKLIS